MTSVSPLDRIPYAARPLVLLALLGTGLILMWYFAESVAPRAGFLSGTARMADQSHKTVQAEDSAPLRERQEQKHPNPEGHVSFIPRGGASGSTLDRTDRSPAAPKRTEPVRSNPPAVAQTTILQAPQAGQGSPKGRQHDGRQQPRKPVNRIEEEKTPRYPAIVVREGGQFVETGPVLFSTGLATLRNSSLQPLDRLADMLRDHPEIRLSIIGYTDNLGPESVNQKLSGDRAAAVVEYLVDRGVDRARLEPRGSGSQDPTASNETQMGRQANRRIAFLVTSSK
jgi:outer membrane protein OmpA-like peptidoglycan-associated protein